MSPAFIVFDVAYMLAANPIIYGYIFIGSVVCSNSHYIQFCQPCIGLIFAGKLPALICHILHVIVVRPQNQMRRINAQTNITTMHHARSVMSFPLWNGSRVEQITNSVGELWPTTQFEHPIALIVGVRRPDPTVRWRNIGPFFIKTLLYCFHVGNQLLIAKHEPRRVFLEILIPLPSGQLIMALSCGFGVGITLWESLPQGRGMHRRGKSHRAI